MKIRISSIKGANHPIRTKQDQEKMDELIQSIAQQGLIVPIKVRPDGDMYEVIYGHRRLHACATLGLAEIECVVEGVGNRDQLIQALTENVVREEMNEPDIARAIKSMKSDYEITNVEAGKMLGWSRDKVEAYLKLTEGEVGKALESYRGSFPYHYAMEARAGSKDEKLAAEVVKKAIDEGLNRNQIRKVAEAASTAKTPEEKRAILETPIENPMFDRVVRAKKRAKIEEKEREAKKHMGNTQEVKEFTDAIRAFEQAIKEVYGAIDFGKFSPEAKQYTKHRLDKLILTIQDLQAKLED